MTVELETRTMHGFEREDRVAASDYYTIWRRNSVVGMEVFGKVDDARSDGWRDALAAEFRRAGYPRYYAMDVGRADASISPAGRYRTIAFVRATLRQLEWAALLARGHAGPVLLVRAMLRVVAMNNITLCIDRRVLERSIDAMLRGELRGLPPRE